MSNTNISLIVIIIKKPDHWRFTINADVYRRLVPGTQTSQGKGRGGGRSAGSESESVHSISMSIFDIYISNSNNYYYNYYDNHNDISAELRHQH